MRTLKQCEQRILDLEGLLGVSERKSDVLTSLLMEANAEFEDALDRVGRSEKNFRAIFETAPEPIYLIDLLTHRIVDCNDLTLDWLGYSRDAFVSMPAESIVAVEPGGTDDHCGQPQYREQMTVSGWRFRKRDGTLVEAEVTGTPLEYKGRESFAVWARDITERKRAEEALRRSEANYRAIFDSVDDAVFVHDIETGAVLDVNQKMCEMYGYSREEARRLTVGDISSGEPPYSQENAMELIRKATDGEATICEWLAKDKAGRLFWIEVNLKRALIDGEPRLLAVVRDISQRKRSEEEREHLRSQLLQTQKTEALGTLAGGISHDFNNLLTIILGYTELVLSEMGDKNPNYQDLEKVIQTAQKGADLVQRLLTFSKQAPTSLRPLNLNDEIGQFTTLLSRTIPKMIEIELALSDDLSAVNSDPVQINQILMNLAINAKDAMPQGGKLCIKTRNVALDEQYCKKHPGMKPADYVLLTISDTGQGMNSDTMACIFDPFFTTKGWDSRKGTGLGLAVAKGIVEQHGGHISCCSDPGKGTTFNIYFPSLGSREKRKETRVVEIHPGGTETILLADDEEMIRDLGCRILEKYGYTVITASNGKEALNVYGERGNEISLVILDLIMPEMGGEQCLEGLLSLDPSVKVIIASGLSVEGASKETLVSRTRGFVNKPYERQQVLQAVRSVLDGK